MLAVSLILDITGDIDVSGAGIAARDYIPFEGHGLLLFSINFRKGAGGANFNTSVAINATVFTNSFAHYGSHAGRILLVIHLINPDATDIPANAHASAADDTEVIVAVIIRVVAVDFFALDFVWQVGGHADIVCNPL